jgi:class 3 adenylate cyclase
MLVLVIFSLFVLNVAWGYFFEVRATAGWCRASANTWRRSWWQMAEDPNKYNMDGESRELTVMFVDVRGFTTISEGLTPKALREYINLYLTAMSEDIRSAHQGTLDKYIGDAVMAFWGAPVAFDDHASRGVATSLLMQASKRLNQDFLARGWPELKIGIGLNTGMMHVGDMGSNIRRAYTVMGDAVNLGSRLEGITKVYGVGIAVGEHACGRAGIHLPRAGPGARQRQERTGGHLRTDRAGAGYRRRHPGRKCALARGAGRRARPALGPRPSWPSCRRCRRSAACTSCTSSASPTTARIRRARTGTASPPSRPSNSAFGNHDAGIRQPQFSKKWWRAREKRLNF